jgi:hypothetical protein
MKNINKEFIPYEEALALKKLGFDEPCFGYFSESQQLHLCRFENMSDKGFVSAPTYSQAFRWFREVYGLDCFIDKGGIKGIYHAFVGGSEHGFLYGNNGNRPSEFTYEEAELACLIKLIEITKTK